nr:vacuolar protein sorting-associated protein 13B isoform X2 [Parasteatoda tepidariorum]
MFKLESYITPLLLSYVDKYIKNLKPEDSQFSLWGGDAVFCNLDLRLDVLEQELQLPFYFVNGHIHELRIHIPWTKLGSEPVVITINTIECILKLRHDGTNSDSDIPKSHQTEKSSSQSNKSCDSIEAPPGYIQSLLNHVISNICIVCNNLILKYVEDDIVLSLNIKSVELYNAGENWERTYVDTNQSGLVSRKVITMQDLTVCLDKRDSCGKIEAYQDPLLYRCSTTWRMYNLYDSVYSKYPKLTRIHMYCDNLEFSLTDQQLPMFLRLLYLCVYLHNKSNLSNQESRHVNDSNEIMGSLMNESSSFEENANEESWGSWAMSFVPDVGLILGSSTNEEQEKESNILKSKKIFQFGIFIGKTSCVLKHTVISSTKYSFAPSLLFNLFGCSMEYTSKGKDFANIQIGIGGATISGYEECVCGYQDSQSSYNDTKKIFLKSGVPPGNSHPYSFLTSSLFDPLAPENCNQERKYCFSKEEHLSTLSEEVMFQRYPALAFDYLYELLIPEDWNDRLSELTSSFLEESNWPESSTARLVFGPFCFEVTSSVVHKLTKLLHCAQDYEYPSYTQIWDLPLHQICASKDIELLEESVPSRLYQLTLFKPVVHLFIANHFPYSNTLSKKGKKRTSKLSKVAKVSKSHEKLFCLEFYAECIDFQSSYPMYPNKLVKIVKGLQSFSPLLENHCYNSYSGKVFGFEISLHKENPNSFFEPAIIHQTNITIFLKTRILPESWDTHEDLTLKEFTLECSQIQLRLSELKVLALIAIYKAWTVKHFNSSNLEKLQQISEKLENDFHYLSLEVTNIFFTYIRQQDLTFMKFLIECLSLKFFNQNMFSVLLHAPESTSNIHEGIVLSQSNDLVTQTTKEENFFQLLLQIPYNASIAHPSLCIVRISGSAACFEPALFSWLDHDVLSLINMAVDLEATSTSSVELDEASTCSSLTHEPSASLSFSKSNFAVFDKAKEISFREYVESIFAKHSSNFSYLLVEVDIGCLCVLLPQSNWSIVPEEDLSTLLTWQRSLLEGNLDGACIFSFPQIKMKNNNFISNFLQNVNFSLTNSAISGFQTDKKCEELFPWTLEINNWSIYSIYREKKMNDETVFLWPVSFLSTIALSQKNKQNQLAFCVHMDCKILHLNVSSFHSEHLVQIFQVVTSTLNFVKKINSWSSNFHLLPSNLYQRELLNVCVVPKSNSHSKQSIPDEASLLVIQETKQSKKLTLWAQLTLSKLTIILLTKLKHSSNHLDFKLKFDAEEIVSSLDIQEVYCKVKVKMSSLNVNCFKRQFSSHDWISGPYEGVVFFCNSILPKAVKSKTFNDHANIGQLPHLKQDTQPFLTLTYTQALHSSASKKWSLNPKHDFPTILEGKDYISEIDLKLNSFGIILWMSILDSLQQSLPHYSEEPVKPAEPENVNMDKNTIGMEFCSYNLPLFYIDTKIMQFYFPENNILINYNKNNKITDLNETEVLFLQLDSATLTSQVENPLPRIILNSELYNAALNSKTIGMPGAVIEDRQYQIDVNSLAIGTISGSNILHHNEVKGKLDLKCPIIMGENPALEWNIGAIPENRKIPDERFLITPIVSPINVKVIVAPAVICRSLNKDFMIENILVAGISVEINVTNEVSLYLSTQQICLLNALLQNNVNFLLELYSNHSHNIGTGFLEDSISDSVNFNLKSILHSQSEDPFITEFEKVPSHNFVPFEVLVTAGTVSAMLYYYNISKISSLDPSNTNNQSKMIKNFKNAIENNENKELHPFLYLSVIQPHSYLLCQPSSQKFESSCFDIELSGSPADFIVEKPYISVSPVSTDFIFSYLETKPGELHQKTGIPPALLTIRCLDIFEQNTHMTISIERPLKFNLVSNMWKAFESFMERLQLEFLSVKDSSSILQPVSNENEMDKQMKFLSLFQKITLSTTQLVIDLVPSIKDKSEVLIFSVGSLKMESEFEIRKEEIKSCDLMLTVSSLSLQTNCNEEIWTHIHPSSFSSTVKCHFKPCLQFETSFIAESILLRLSLRHTQVLKNLVEHFLNIYYKSQKEKTSNFEEKEIKCDENNLNSLKKKIYWTDDLRKGAFQFIQTSSKESQPKSYEIVFCHASADHPASMTWCYPEPRFLTKVDVSPVPFQTDVEDFNEESQCLSCYLQYWNSADKEYINLCDFVLSETKHISLNLLDLDKDSIAMSDKWRVLLDCGGRYVNEDNIYDKRKPLLSPLALAACMSVDSCFDANLVPLFRMRASFELLKMICYNHFEKTGCSPSLHPFEFDDECPSNQEFSAVSFVNPNISYSNWNSKIKTELSSGVTWDILEYRNLTMLPLISPVDIHASISFTFGKNKEHAIDMDFLIHPCFVRLSQSAIHTLSYTFHMISQQQAIGSSFCTEYVLPNYYLICNNLEERILFGQSGTDENILLSPMKMHAYSWYCNKTKQVLWLSVKSLAWKWSKEFSIDEEGTHVVQFDNRVGAIIKIKKLSNLQKQVIIDGHLAVQNLLSFPIQFKCEFSNIVTLTETPSNANVMSIKSLAPKTKSPAFLLSSKEYKGLSLSFTAILDSQIWSHTVQLEDNKIIEIPWSIYNQYQCVRYQVVKQKISSKCWSFKVFISPLLILRNHLPFSLNINIMSENDNTLFDITGKGNETACLMKSVNDQIIQVNAISENGFNIKMPALPISLSNLKDVPITLLNETENLDYCFSEMESVLHKSWPYSFFDSCSKYLINFVDSMYICSETINDVIPAIPEDVCCVLKVEKSQRWIGLNTVLLDIKPEMVLINRLRHVIYLHSEHGLEWTLPASSVAPLASPYNGFQLSVMEDGVHYFSSSLTVEGCNVSKSKTEASMDTTFSINSTVIIPTSGSSNIIIPLKADTKKVFLFKLLTEVQEGIVVITAFPLVSLVNKSDIDLHFSLICASGSDANMKCEYSNDSSLFIEGKSDNCHPLLSWRKISLASSDALSFYIYVSTSCKKWSYPICFHTKLNNDNRHAVSLPTGSVTTHPLIFTSHWRKGLLFLVLNNDPCPLLLLHNHTNLNLYYGQSCFQTEGKSVVEEVENSFVPLINPGCSSHYSFPSMDKSFPVSLDSVPMLCIGLKENDNQNYLWSNPFKVNLDKQFIHVLGVCDFMIQTECIGHTTNLYIDIVKRIEVTANEVRSRIDLATKSQASTKDEYVKQKVLGDKILNSLEVSSTKHFNVVKKNISLDSDHTHYPNTYYLNMRVIHVSVVFCDEFFQWNKNIEVLRVNIDNALLFLRPKNINSKVILQDISLCFGHIQVDNQIENYDKTIGFDFPVILHRGNDLKEEISISKENTMFLPNKIRENAMFILNAVIEHANEENCSIILKSCEINLLPISLYLEDKFYFKCIALYKSYTPANFHHHISDWKDIYLPEDVITISSMFIHPIHFQSLKINVQEISLSIRASLKLYLSLEHSPLRFQPFVKEELFTTYYEAGRILMMHYLTGALFRAGWVVGSLDILGNPATFARAVGAGVADFVYLPYKGLLKGPKAFITGLSNGALSLFTQVSSGILTCMASLTASISKNMDYLCLDEEHLARQEMVRHRLPQGVSEGLFQGLSVFGLSLLSAIAGIVDHPLQVLVSPSTPIETASGVVSGLGKGIVGIFTKPIGGAAELFSQTGYGLLHGAGWLIPPKRQYQPVTVSFEMTPSSLVKYVSKVALYHSLGEVLLSSESTYVNENGEYEKNILLLTTEALCILADDEFTVLHTFALTEIRCNKSEADRSTLIVIPSGTFHKQDSRDALDRVVDYLKKNRVEISSDFETSFFNQEITSDTFAKSNSSCFIFFLYPKDRNLFLTLFNYAKNKALRKGF